ncbi:MAG TPA: TolC family protein [Chitinophagales bacterium]|nr:TolC family protein [Chitinophagales bacterium]HMV01942.1 TolC family protein [Chitinophagales bacterium]HMW93880.1 TolC family protein [Chitinophagales bacterium]HMY42088.1 TolC family protein [Chitinophagales bacterium]HMZ67831.1 TolC family protein [Chitinophagales bacterium]
MKFFHKLLISLILFGASSSYAQEVMTPEEAVAYAVSKNFDIVLAKNDAEVAKVLNNKASAGMLPKINLNTGDVFNLNNLNQKFASGQNVKQNWVAVNSLNAGVSMDWTIFDGMKMFATKDRLAALQSLGEIQLKNQIQDVAAQTLNAYYNIVRQKQQIKAAKELIGISEERVNLSQKKLDVGYSDKTPLLQAKVDLSTQQINILKQETLLEQAKINLNQIIGRNADEPFDVIDNIEVNYQPNLQTIRDTTTSTNYLLAAAKKNIEIAQFQRKEINAQRLPQINFTSGYNFVQNNNKAGFQLFNRVYGPSVGVSAKIPIFNGGMVKKDLQAASINIAKQQIQYDKLKQDIDAGIVKAYKDFELSEKMLQLNEENVQIAAENVQITMERYRLNQSTSLDIKQAQSSYEDALYNVILARYNSKVAEIELKRIINNLLD